tara:strand:- start:1104 stop:1394 length:291 start_codon:yes stop_codon:yes gene_type:complete
VILDLKRQNFGFSDRAVGPFTGYPQHFFLHAPLYFSTRCVCLTNKSQEHADTQRPDEYVLKPVMNFYLGPSRPRTGADKTPLSFAHTTFNQTARKL